MTAVLHRIFGLRLRVNRPVANLDILAAGSEPVDVQIQLGCWPQGMGELSQKRWYTSPYRHRNGQPVLVGWEVGDVYLRLRYGDGVEFPLDRVGTQVWATWPASAGFQAATDYLLGSLLALVLGLRGTIALHAGAVVVGDRALLLLGAEGSGKSTLAAALAARGYPVLADDLVALGQQGDHFIAQPGMPWLRLRPTAAPLLAQLQGFTLQLIPAPDGDHLDLDLRQNGCRYARQPLPVAAIYWLRQPAPTTRIEPASFQTIWPALLAESWVSRLHTRAMRAQQFVQLAQLAEAVPLRCVSSRPGGPGLTGLGDAILQDFEALQRSRAWV